VLPPANFRLGGTAPQWYARAFALLAAEPYVEKRISKWREDYWAGDLASGERKAVRQQLFKGNEYWFLAGNGKSIVQRCPFIFIIRTEKLAETTRQFGRKDHFAAAHIIPKKPQAVYFIIVSVEASPAARTPLGAGVWFSDKVGFLAGNCMGAMPDTTN